MNGKIDGFISVAKQETSKQQSDTVFIDLRNFDKTRQEQQQSIERVQRILNISCER